MEKILIPFYDPELVPVDVVDFKVELHNDHLLIFHKFKVISTDDSTGIKKEVKSYGERMIIKKFICGVDLYFGKQTDAPILKINCSGSEDYDFFIEEYQVAKDAYTRIKNWLLT